MAAFTDLAINANNYLRLVRLPVEMACLLVEKLFSRVRSRRLVTLHWRYHPPSPAPGPAPGTPHEIISCRVDAVRVKACRLRPIQFCCRVMVEVTYLIGLVVVYRDRAGRIGVTRLEKEVSHHSRSLPGTIFMSGTAGITLALVDCRIGIRPAGGRN